MTLISRLAITQGQDNASLQMLLGPVRQAMRFMVKPLVVGLPAGFDDELIESLGSPDPGLISASVDSAIDLAQQWPLSRTELTRHGFATDAQGWSHNLAYLADIHADDLLAKRGRELHEHDVMFRYEGGVMWEHQLRLLAKAVERARWVLNKVPGWWDDTRLVEPCGFITEAAVHLSTKHRPAQAPRQRGSSTNAVHRWEQLIWDLAGVTEPM